MITTEKKCSHEILLLLNDDKVNNNIRFHELEAVFTSTFNLNIRHTCANCGEKVFVLKRVKKKN